MKSWTVFGLGALAGAVAAWAGMGARTASGQEGVVAPTGMACPCPGDANCDGIVDFNDIVTVLGNWLDQCAPDGDGDGIPDQQDNCPTTPNPTQADDDGDGVGNECDNCPINPNPGQEDSDNDQFGDACDCDPIDPLVNPGAAEDCTNGIDDDCDGFVDGNDFDCMTDSDADGVPDAFDNCPTVPNPPQSDLDGDQFGDACDCDPIDPLVNPGAGEDCMNGIDDDCDGFVDANDFDCAVDSDMDGVPDMFDNCPTAANPLQENDDADGYGAACDCDDGDPSVNPGAAEDCMNGIDDDCDGFVDGNDFDCNPDWDGDGVPNVLDNCPLVPNPTQIDSDNDGYGSLCDCNDNIPSINPGQTEVCPDMIDNDCDGFIDNCPPRPARVRAPAAGTRR